MRNTLILLSSLALAAAAHAGIIGVSSSITTATYHAISPVTLSNVLGEEYHHEENYGPDVDGGGAVGTTSASTIHSFDGATFVMGSMTSATLLADTPDFSQYTGEIGYRYFFDLESDVDQTITFKVTFMRSSQASATGHIYTPDEFYGDYSDGTGFGGVGPLDVSDDRFLTTGSSTFDFDPTDDVVFGPSYSGVINREEKFDLKAGVTRRFELWAYTDSNVQFVPNPVPVPEPAPLAALGLGALGLLRRRKARS